MVIKCAGPLASVLLTPSPGLCLVSAPQAVVISGYRFYRCDVVIDCLREGATLTLTPRAHLLPGPVVEASY